MSQAAQFFHPETSERPKAQIHPSNDKTMLDIMTEEASSIASNSLRYVSTGRRTRAEGRKQHAGESRVELTEAGGHTRAEQGGRRLQYVQTKWSS